MDDKQVVFIICYNDDLCFSECKRYINNLNVPENMEVSIVGIDNANSLPEGYNRAMHATDAKYKVYLHQDVFIINPRFIEEVIAIFKEDDSIGMIGVLGKKERDTKACYWISWDEGRTYATTPISVVDYNLQKDNKSTQDVVAIDGMIMATQYNIEWREDVFDGFDFYDVSQSEEFLKAGYRIIIPFQEKPWCIHDCGVTKLKRYDYYRQKFCELYKSNGYSYEPFELIDYKVKMNELASRICEIACKRLENGEFDLFNDIMGQALDAIKFSTELEILFVFWQCLKMEYKADLKDSFFKEGKDIEEYFAEYIKCRRLVRRVEFDRTDGADENSVKEYIGTIGGSIFLYNVITYSALNVDLILKRTFQ